MATQMDKLENLENEKLATYIYIVCLPEGSLIYIRYYLFSAIAYSMQVDESLLEEAQRFFCLIASVFGARGASGEDARRSSRGVSYE
eukprot:SAG11_NODE_595_length_8300_cov_38.415437_3_plen_87_part_00